MDRLVKWFMILSLAYIVTGCASTNQRSDINYVKRTTERESPRSVMQGVNQGVINLLF